MIDTQKFKIVTNYITKNKVSINFYFNNIYLFTVETDTEKADMVIKTTLKELTTTFNLAVKDLIEEAE